MSIDDMGLYLGPAQQCRALEENDRWLKKDHGKRASGKPISDDLIDRLAAKAEADYDAEETLRRRPGPPKMGSAPAQVKVGPPLSRVAEALDTRAERDHEATSSVIRKALREYLQVG